MTARKRPGPRRAGARRRASDEPALAAALLEAATRVAASWPRHDLGRVGASDLDAGGRVLLAAVEDVRAGRAPRLDGIPPFVPARRYLDAIRQSWLASDAVQELPACDIVDVVRAMDVVLRALDDDAAHRFASRLGSLDAQQLVVEMAHDMRSPLGSILILAERLRAGTLPPVQQRQVGLIYSAAFGLSSLAGDVIELARGGATLLDSQPIPFSVSGVMQAIVDMLRPMAEEKHLGLRWEGPQHNVRYGHPAALNRVLLNLATNALKFTNVGEVVLHAAEPDETHLVFSVSDSGRGIPPTVMRHLFECFRQRQTPGDYAFSSAGLGLSICQKLVRAMGGELTVETELERGTTFSFSLELPGAGSGYEPPRLIP